MIYKNYIKRLIDIVLSSIGLIVLAVSMAVIAVIVKLDSKGPVLFWQKRAGIHKTTFMMPKFRTMYTDTPANMPTHMLNNLVIWITKSARRFRKLSLDELSQILSILINKISIVSLYSKHCKHSDPVDGRNKHHIDCVIIHSHKYIQLRTALMEVAC